MLTQAELKAFKQFETRERGRYSKESLSYVTSKKNSHLPSRFCAVLGLMEYCFERGFEAAENEGGGNRVLFSRYLPPVFPDVGDNGVLDESACGARSGAIFAALSAEQAERVSSIHPCSSGISISGTTPDSRRLLRVQLSDVRFARVGIFLTKLTSSALRVLLEGGSDTSLHHAVPPRFEDLRWGRGGRLAPPEPSSGQLISLVRLIFPFLTVWLFVSFPKLVCV